MLHAFVACVHTRTHLLVGVHMHMSCTHVVDIHICTAPLAYMAPLRFDPSRPRHSYRFGAWLHPAHAIIVALCDCLPRDHRRVV